MSSALPRPHELSDHFQRPLRRGVARFRRERVGLGLLFVALSAAGIFALVAGIDSSWSRVATATLSGLPIGLAMIAWGALPKFAALDALERGAKQAMWDLEAVTGTGLQLRLVFTEPALEQVTLPLVSAGDRDELEELLPQLYPTAIRSSLSEIIERVRAEGRNPRELLGGR